MSDGGARLPPRRCPACLGPLRPWRAVPSAEPSLGAAPFRLLRCRSCASARTLGEPDSEWHESGAYAPGEPRLHRLVRPLLARFDRRRLSLLARLVPPPARVLDAGAGRGRWVLAARAAGYEAFGIEPSERGLAGAARIGAPVRQASIEDATLPPATLEAVSLWHVLEHLEEPDGALARIREWLAPGGGLLLGVPNLASLQAQLGGGRWYHLDVPRHRVHFTPPGVRLLLERSGFRVLEVHHVLAEHNPFGMWQSLVNRLTRQPSYLYNLLKHNAPLASPDLVLSLAALPALPAAALLELLAGAAGRGGTIAVLARRA